MTVVKYAETPAEILAWYDKQIKDWEREREKCLSIGAQIYAERARIQIHIYKEKKQRYEEEIART